MGQVQIVAAFQLIPILTRFLHWTPQNKVGNTLPNNNIYHLTVTALSAVSLISIGEMPPIQTAADFQPISILTRISSLNSIE
jgi:hypothetical protein